MEKELEKELPNIDRNQQGFEDFAHEGKRAIEPGNPSKSLLYHALASPNVAIAETNPPLITDFPTLAEIEAVENYVFGANPPSLLELRAKAGRNRLLAIVIYAYEYRPAPETVHRKHADLCFSRTGLARVGTADPHYDPKLRGFLPFVDGQDNMIRVLPTKFSAFIAIQLMGDKNRFGPMRFREGSEDGMPSDNLLNFWVPIHKLFAGKECIRGLDLHINFEHQHVNEKLRRIHIELKRIGENSSWAEPDISKPPFIFTDGIAEFSTRPDIGTGLLVPAVHAQLAEPAQYKGKSLSFLVPKNNQTLSSSLYLPDEDNARHAPEYVHVRTKLMEDGSKLDLNANPNVLDIVRNGGYNALHYIDHTGDGWVKVVCPELAVEVPRNIPAYSLVTAPDFFPNCDQRELMDWWEQSVPSSLKEIIWRIPPYTLSDQRIAPNVELKEAGFRREDKTATAIVSLLAESPPKLTSLDVKETTRHSYLPDAASGVFAPGWDISFDRTRSGDEHLAAYGLGSPFPEDSKLCAALSTFWPAVAPDAARTFQPNATGAPWPTVSPLTDEEIGITAADATNKKLPWDGIPGPHLVPEDNTVEYTEFDHADYTLNAIHNKFSLSLTGKIGIGEYKARVLAMARVYEVLKSTDVQRRASWSVLSFRKVQSPNKELDDAQSNTSTKLEGPIYRFEVYRHGNKKDSTIPQKIRVEILQERVTLFISPIAISYKIGSGPWKATAFRDV